MSSEGVFSSTAATRRVRSMDSYVFKYALSEYAVHGKLASGGPAVIGRKVGEIVQNRCLERGHVFSWAQLQHWNPTCRYSAPWLLQPPRQAKWTISARVHHVSRNNECRNDFLDIADLSIRGAEFPCQPNLLFFSMDFRPFFALDPSSPQLRSICRVRNCSQNVA